MYSMTTIAAARRNQSSSRLELADTAELGCNPLRSTAPNSLGQFERPQLGHSDIQAVREKHLRRVCSIRCRRPVILPSNVKRANFRNSGSRRARQSSWIMAMLLSSLLFPREATGRSRRAAIASARVTACRKDCARRRRASASRAYRFASFPRSRGRAVPAPSVYRHRSPRGEWQTNVAARVA
jgi:hypothetical protein